MDWRAIDGFLTDAEGDLLRLLSTNQIVLEIGSLFGRSTICMAQVAKHVHAVDPHRPGNTDFREHLKGRDSLAELRQNLRAAGVEHRVSLHVCTVTELWLPAVPLFDLVFIDGSHREPDVLLDLEFAARCLRPGGSIACHDHTSGHQGVVDAVRAFGRPVRQQVDGLAVI
jgi:predicted O-methyltransferase YrrM